MLLVYKNYLVIIKRLLFIIFSLSSSISLGSISDTIPENSEPSGGYVAPNNEIGDVALLHEKIIKAALKASDEEKREWDESAIFRYPVVFYNKNMLNEMLQKKGKFKLKDDEMLHVISFHESERFLSSFKQYIEAEGMKVSYQISKSRSYGTQGGTLSFDILAKENNYKVIATVHQGFHLSLPFISIFADDTDYSVANEKDIPVLTVCAHIFMDHIKYQNAYNQLIACLNVCQSYPDNLINDEVLKLIAWYRELVVLRQELYILLEDDFRYKNNFGQQLYLTKQFLDNTTRLAVQAGRLVSRLAPNISWKFYDIYESLPHKETKEETQALFESLSSSSNITLDTHLESAGSLNLSSANQQLATDQEKGISQDLFESVYSQPPYYEEESSESGIKKADDEYEPDNPVRSKAGNRNKKHTSMSASLRMPSFTSSQKKKKRKAVRFKPSKAESLECQASDKESIEFYDDSVNSSFWSWDFKPNGSGNYKDKTSAKKGRVIPPGWYAGMKKRRAKQSKAVEINFRKDNSYNVATRLTQQMAEKRTVPIAVMFSICVYYFFNQDLLLDHLDDAMSILFEVARLFPAVIAFASMMYLHCSKKITKRKRRTVRSIAAFFGAFASVQASASSYEYYRNKQYLSQLPSFLTSFKGNHSLSLPINEQVSYVIFPAKESFLLSGVESNKVYKWYRQYQEKIEEYHRNHDVEGDINYRMKRILPYCGLNANDDLDLECLDIFDSITRSIMANDLEHDLGRFVCLGQAQAADSKKSSYTITMDINKLVRIEVRDGKTSLNKALKIEFQPCHHLKTGSTMERVKICSRKCQNESPCKTASPFIKMPEHYKSGTYTLSIYTGVYGWNRVRTGMRVKIDARRRKIKLRNIPESGYYALYQPLGRNVFKIPKERVLFFYLEEGNVYVHLDFLMDYSVF